MAVATWCPACSAPLVAPVPQCPQCGLPLVGEVAARLLQLDEVMASLQAERERLLAQLRAPEAEAPPAPGVGATGADVPPGSAAPPAHTWSASGPVLVGAGVLALVVSTVFVVAAWSVLRVPGQVSLLALGGLGTGATAVWLARHRRTQTAEAVALVTVAVLAAALGAVPAFDLFGSGRVDGGVYLVVAAAAAAVLLWLTVRLAPGVASFQGAMVCAAGFVPVGVVTAGRTPASGRLVVVAAVFLLASAAFAAASVKVWRGTWRTAGAAAWVVALVYVALTFVTATVAALVAPSAAERVGGALTLLVTAGAAAGAAPLFARADRPVAARVALPGVAFVAAPLGLVMLAAQSGFPRAALTAGVVAAVAVGCAVTLRAHVERIRWVLAAALAQATGLVAVALLASAGAPVLALAGVALLALPPLAGAVTPQRTRRKWRAACWALCALHLSLAVAGLTVSLV